MTFNSIEQTDVIKTLIFSERKFEKCRFKKKKRHGMFLTVFRLQIRVSNLF